MKADLINPVIAATTKVFGQRLGCPLTRGEPFLRGATQPTYEVVGVLGLTGEMRATVLLGAEQHTVEELAKGLRQRRNLPNEGPPGDALGIVLQWIAEEITTDRRASLPTVVRGQSPEILFPAALTPLCIPFQSPWGGLTIEVAVVEQDAEVDQMDKAGEMLAAIAELASSVARGVGEHNTKVQEINHGLKQPDSQNETGALTAIHKLIAVNEHMERQLAAAEQKLQDQAREIETHSTAARTDPLTGLANRRAFDDAMARCVENLTRRGEPATVMMVDVDFFKKFNDSYGHKVGDEVLKGVGAMLRQAARDHDIVSRYGGEEFTVLFPNTTIEQAAAVAEAARKEIHRAQIQLNGKTLRVTASAGLAELQVNETIATLLDRADAALYASKAAGRNCHHWHDGHDTHPVREWGIDTEVEADRSSRELTATNL
jgi:diguanylate cyclase (GGDEF)-like protein